MKINQNILEMLVKVAMASNEEMPTRLAAAIVMRNKVISIGVNRMKSHPFQKKYGKNEDAIYWHAEIDAIKSALREISVDDLSKCDLYIARVKKPKPKSNDWIWGLSKPCEGCQRAILAFGLRRTIYTTDEHGKYGVME
jgi:deoxycytidylate deaminase